MKNLFVALALFGMIRSVSAITVASAGNNNIVTLKGDKGDKDKKKKRNKKKDGCSSSADSTKKDGCAPAGDKKKCCSGH